MIKLGKQFRDSSLEKSQDPDLWITESEDFCVRFDYMDSGFKKINL
jgi:hypothetical protein